MTEKTEKSHKFKQKCFFMTGGSQGLGGAITQRLATSNATVAV
jgi:NAD(P)-dependent dehydrogenase (short-subunit alcohol dehydrogenase family)